jgi:hypothetical protein
MLKIKTGSLKPFPVADILFNNYLIRPEYNRDKGRKKNSPIMNEIITKILTDKSARGADEVQTLAIAQNSFESWE